MHPTTPSSRRPTTGTASGGPSICPSGSTGASPSFWAANPTPWSWSCSASCGPSTAATKTPGRCCGGCLARANASCKDPAKTRARFGSGRRTIVFKIESHNHPSFVSPYHGAATGVGGILRDMFTMGARPVAVLASLRFGPQDAPRQRELLDGVRRGIRDYAGHGRPRGGRGNSV